MDGNTVNEHWDAALPLLKEGDHAGADVHINPIYHGLSSMTDYMLNKLDKNLKDVIVELEYDSAAWGLAGTLQREVKVEIGKRRINQRGQ